MYMYKNPEQRKKIYELAIKLHPFINSESEQTRTTFWRIGFYDERSEFYIPPNDAIKFLEKWATHYNL